MPPSSPFSRSPSPSSLPASVTSFTTGSLTAILANPCANSQGSGASGSGCAVTAVPICNCFVTNCGEAIETGAQCGNPPPATGSSEDIGLVDETGVIGGARVGGARRGCLLAARSSSATIATAAPAGISVFATASTTATNDAVREPAQPSSSSSSFTAESPPSFAAVSSLRSCCDSSVASKSPRNSDAVSASSRALLPASSLSASCRPPFRARAVASTRDNAVSAAGGRRGTIAANFARRSRSVRSALANAVAIRISPGLPSAAAFAAVAVASAAPSALAACKSAPRGSPSLTHSCASWPHAPPSRGVASADLK
mmetsp:Transcript_33330/g.83080  ORF Transcript_33330/g.83080 Transcript_33330/m.83080 type:complete len:314 (+) Transcript_33330:182-1123(+)